MNNAIISLCGSFFPGGTLYVLRNLFTVLTSGFNPNLPVLYFILVDFVIWNADPDEIRKLF